MKLSRILGLLAVLLVLPLTLALKDGPRVSIASAQCQATVGNCCFWPGAECEAGGGEEPLYNYIYSATGCGKP